VATGRLIIAPAVEPLTLDECRVHLGVVPYEVDSEGVGTHPHDEMIMALLGAAREFCEAELGYPIAAATYEARLDAFPAAGSVVVLDPPASALLSIDDDVVGTDADVTTADVRIDTAGRLWPISGTWPDTTGTIVIRYLSGPTEGTDAPPLPRAIRSAILLMLTHLYENRSDSTERPRSTIPNGVEALLGPLRTRLGMA
jgi:uncharacterized phiE125 gp8 family phage protein